MAGLSFWSAKTSTSSLAASFLSEGTAMPEAITLERARRDKEQGKSPSTQAGEFVREEIHHIREGKHGAANTKQAIAIGLSKARRAGVKLGTPKSGSASNRTRKQAQRDLAKGRRRSRTVSRKRSQASEKALKRQPRSAASRSALSRQATQAARRSSSASRSQAAKKAARTKGPAVRRRAAQKAAETRQRRAA